MFNFTSCDISFLVLLIYLYYNTLVFNFTSFDITYLDTYTFVFNLTSFDRVPAQVLQSLIKSYIGFSICKAVQCLICGYFRPQMSYKDIFLLKIFFHCEKEFLSWKLC